MISSFGARDFATRSDCIIVLGAAIQGSAPSPVFEQRIRHAVKLHQDGLAKKILFTGGVGAGQTRSESRVGANFAASLGIPSTSILLEEKSHTTRQNLSEAQVLLKQNQLSSAIIVSDPLHMKRALKMANDLGIPAVSSPTPTTRYITLGARTKFLLREIFFYQYYLVTQN